MAKAFHLHNLGKGLLNSSLSFVASLQSTSCLAISTSKKASYFSL